MKIKRSAVITLYSFIAFSLVMLLGWFVFFIMGMNEDKSIQVLIRLQVDQDYRQFRNYLESEIARISTLNPENELRKAILGKKVEFLGVVGNGLEFPGIPEKVWPDLNEESYEIIDPTGEVVVDNLHRRFKSLAAEYAGKYNRLLQKKGKK